MAVDAPGRAAQKVNTPATDFALSHARPLRVRRGRFARPRMGWFIVLDGVRGPQRGPYFLRHVSHQRGENLPHDVGFDRLFACRRPHERALLVEVVARISTNWWSGVAYDLSPVERRVALEVAAEAARRIGVPFLVIDVAQRNDGRWMVIECNDGQESGHAGVSPLSLWHEIIEVERAQSQRP
jgi:hypothetical protein